MFRDKKQIFSIRKTLLGVGSVLLGVMLTTQVIAAEETVADVTVATTPSLVAEAPAITTKVVEKAATTTLTDTSAATTLSPDVTAAAVGDSVVTETVIASPIRYVSDDTQPVGYQVVQTQGTDGKLITTTVNGVSTVQRIEPTENCYCDGDNANNNDRGDCTSYN